MITAPAASQRAAILAWLKAGRSITPAEAIAWFNCYRLAARIYDLRLAGYAIVTQSLRTDGNRCARYSLIRSRPNARRCR
jgi:hypothetical protein